MKTALLCLVVMCLAINAFSQCTNDNFAGKWKTEDGVIITVTSNNGKLLGTDPKGRPTLYNIHCEKNEWKGTVENHETSQKGNCEIYLQGNTLKVVAHKGLLFKTFYWVKQ